MENAHWIHSLSDCLFLNHQGDGGLIVTSGACPWVKEDVW